MAPAASSHELGSDARLRRGRAARRDQISGAAVQNFGFKVFTAPAGGSIRGLADVETILLLSVIVENILRFQRDRRHETGSPRIVHGFSAHVREILRRIRHGREEPLTLKQIAADLDRQAEYLGWLFRHETGRTFHQQLTIMRLRSAARLIRGGEKIDAVVLLTGYRSKKNFYEQFRRLFGMTPGEYRERLRRGDGVPRGRGNDLQPDVVAHGAL